MSDNLLFSLLTTRKLSEPSKAYETVLASSSYWGGGLLISFAKENRSFLVIFRGILKSIVHRLKFCLRFCFQHRMERSPQSPFNSLCPLYGPPTSDLRFCFIFGFPLIFFNGIVMGWAHNGRGVFFFFWWTLQNRNFKTVFWDWHLNWLSLKTAECMDGDA